MRCYIRFTSDVGFEPEDLPPYVDSVAMFVRDELRAFSQAIAGHANTERSARKREQGIDKIAERLALVRRETMRAEISPAWPPVPGGRCQCVAMPRCTGPRAAIPLVRAVK